MIKNGDFVINFWEDEGHIHIGTVSNMDSEYEEHDMDFIGGGSVSPVSAKDSVVISENLARILAACIEMVPTDNDGMFLFGDKIKRRFFKE